MAAATINRLFLCKKPRIPIVAVVQVFNLFFISRRLGPLHRRVVDNSLNMTFLLRRPSYPIRLVKRPERGGASGTRIIIHRRAGGWPGDRRAFPYEPHEVRRIARIAGSAWPGRLNWTVSGLASVSVIVVAPSASRRRYRGRWSRG